MNKKKVSDVVLNHIENVCKENNITLEELANTILEQKKILKKDFKLNVRFTQKEMKFFSEMAKTYSMSISMYARIISLHLNVAVDHDINGNIRKSLEEFNDFNSETIKATVRQNIYFNSYEELEAIKNKADLLGMKAGTFVRFAVLNGNLNIEKINIEELK